MPSSSWFKELPVTSFRDINKTSNENLTERPEDSPISSVDIKCGPMLKLLSSNNEPNGVNYRSSLLVVAKKCQSIPKLTYKIGPLFETDGDDISDGSVTGTKFYEEGDYQFYRYIFELSFEDYEQRIHYYLNNETTDYWQFFLPTMSQSMNVVTFSCNGFSLGTPADGYKSQLWYDVLKNHKDLHYHVMLGNGDQLYCDGIKLACSRFEDWTKIEDAGNKLLQKVDDEFMDQICNFYLHAYLDWFGKGYWVGTQAKNLQSLFPIALATIPAINIYDDHDIIDGYGSYVDGTMMSPVFKTIGHEAFRYYMIFQHHQLPDEDNLTNSWVLGPNKSRYIGEKNHSIYTQLGKNIACVGFDCRTERSLGEVIKPATYENIFKRVETEIIKNPDIKHLLVMLGVPIMYPRMVWLETLLTSSFLKPIRKLAEKGFINKGLVNEFDGSVEVLDDLNDHWCSHNHKKERNALLKRLLDLGAKHSVRITILSGDVHLGCISRLKSKIYHHPTFHVLGHSKDKETSNKNTLEFPENDPRLLFNVTSSAICNAPPPDPMAQLLDKRSKGHKFTKNCIEDMVPLFLVNPDGSPRDNLQFLNKRNWCDLIMANQAPDSEDCGPENRQFPGSKKATKKLTADEYNIKYPKLTDSLVTTLHFEDDPMDFDCKTMGYELFIPPLKGKYELEKVMVKHVNDQPNNDNHSSSSSSS